MTDENGTQEDEKSAQEGEESKEEGEESPPKDEESKPDRKRSELDLSEDKRLKAGSSALKMSFELSPEAFPKQAAPSPQDTPAKSAMSSAARDKMRPGAFTAVFDKAREKLAAAQDAMKDAIASKALVLTDARPTLADPRSPRDRWVLKDGRALDGIVYLAVPVGKLEWHASFGRECLNYATLARNTDKRHAITPQYGDTVIAYVNTMIDNQAPELVEVDPVDIGDVEAWIQARVEAMLGTIMSRRAVLAKKAKG
jgi:hypothetical protein